MSEKEQVKKEIKKEGEEGKEKEKKEKKEIKKEGEEGKEKEKKEKKENKHPILDLGDVYMFLCPHCEQATQVLKNQVNCKIFRHASYFKLLPNLPKVNGRDQYAPTNPIAPHASKEECDRLVKEGKVLGCAGPFRMVFTKEGNYVEKCPYI